MSLQSERWTRGKFTGWDHIENDGTEWFQPLGVSYDAARPEPSPLSFVDQMMSRALALSAERQKLDGDIQAKCLLVGGISPPDLRRCERLRARELMFLADAKEAQEGWGRRG